MASLVEIDSLDIQVIIDNELDPISPAAPDTVQMTGGSIGHLAMSAPPLQPGDRGDAVKELRMDQLCCSAHGLSIMVTATRGDVKRTVLFDTGPEEDVWERNANRLKADVSQVDLIMLSHWHRDHSGGMLKAIKTINQAKKNKAEKEGGKVTVDLHPSRPDYRGFLMGDKIVSLEADPSFEEITDHGAILSLNGETHTVLDDMFLISGEIPRETSYENGVKFGMRFDKDDGDWFSDEKIADERFLACNLKGKGIVLFTGCSHAGVVNTSRHALKLVNSGSHAKVPLHAVVGGYHLATSHDSKQIEPTVNDLKALDPAVLMPGHCTGWRAKFAIEQHMPGRLVPCTVGTKYVF